MKYKIVVFDLDGTILNTLEDLADSTNYALSVFDMPERTIEEIRHFVGNGIRKLMERAVPQGTPESMIVKVHETFTEHYKKHCADKTRPYDGIKELIENIRNAGVYTAVVSNKADYGVQILCKDYFPGLFDYAVGEREGIRRKPYPDSVNEVLRQFDVDRTQAVYVGDSEVDVQTAANAGMDVCMVGWGFRDEEFLKENGAEFVVHSPEEAWEFINYRMDVLNMKQGRLQFTKLGVLGFTNQFYQTFGDKHCSILVKMCILRNSFWLGKFF